MWYATDFSRIKSFGEITSKSILITLQQKKIGWKQGNKTKAKWITEIEDESNKQERNTEREKRMKLSVSCLIYMYDEWSVAFIHASQVSIF